MEWVSSVYGSTVVFIWSCIGSSVSLDTLEQVVRLSTQLLSSGTRSGLKQTLRRLCIIVQHCSTSASAYTVQLQVHDVIARCSQDKKHINKAFSCQFSCVEKLEAWVSRTRSQLSVVSHFQINGEVKSNLKAENSSKWEHSKGGKMRGMQREKQTEGGKDSVSEKQTRFNGALNGE